MTCIPGVKKMSLNVQKRMILNYKKPKVLFFGREKCDATSKAIKHLELVGFEVTPVFSRSRGEALSESILEWNGDYILCFRSLFILPKILIDKAKTGAINFHPGPPEFPGSGCLNYALYENSQSYGVTAHLMNEKIDEGNILECRRFQIHKLDTVNSLLERTHLKLLDLFFDFTSSLATIGAEFLTKNLQKSKNEKWSGTNRKIKDLDSLSLVNLNISETQLDKLVRATYTELFPPKVILHGYEFLLKSNKKLSSYLCSNTI